MKEIRELFSAISPLQRIVIAVVLLLMLITVVASATKHPNLQPLPTPTEAGLTSIPPAESVPEPVLTPVSDKANHIEPVEATQPTTNTDTPVANDSVQGASTSRPLQPPVALPELPQQVSEPPRDQTTIDDVTDLIDDLGSRLRSIY